MISLVLWITWQEGFSDAPIGGPRTLRKIISWPYPMPPRVGEVLDLNYGGWSEPVTEVWYDLKTGQANVCLGERGARPAIYTGPNDDDSFSLAALAGQGWT